MTNVRDTAFSVSLLWIIISIQAYDLYTLTGNCLYWLMIGLAGIGIFLAILRVINNR